MIEKKWLEIWVPHIANTWNIAYKARLTSAFVANTKKLTIRWDHVHIKTMDMKIYVIWASGINGNRKLRRKYNNIQLMSSQPRVYWDCSIKRITAIKKTKNGDFPISMKLLFYKAAKVRNNHLLVLCIRCSPIDSITSSKFNRNEHKNQKLLFPNKRVWWNPGRWREFWMSTRLKGVPKELENIAEKC